MIRHNAWSGLYFTFITVVTLLLPSGVDAAPVPPSITELVNYSNLAFVGHVTSIRDISYSPTGPCSKGLSTFTAPELEIEVEEVLHGSGIKKRQVVRSATLSSLDSVSPGARVIAYGTRSCADSWRIWVSLLVIDESGQVRVAGRNRNRIGDWNNSNNQRLGLDAFKADARHNANKIPTHGYQSFNNLYLVVVRDVKIESPNVLTVQCQHLSALRGNGVAPVTIRTEVPPANDMKISVGDTLLVPVRGKSGRVLALHTTLDYYKVVNGYLPGLGVDLDGVTTKFKTAPGGLSLHEGVER